MLPGGRYHLATKWEVLFANTFTQTDSESFSSSVIGICECPYGRETWPRHRGYFCLFYIHYMRKFPGRGRVLKLQWTVDFGLLDSYNMWLMKLKGTPAIPVFFLSLMLLIFMLMNFNPQIKLLLFVPQGEDISFFSFLRGANLFSVHLFTKERIRKVEEFTFLANPCTVCIVHSLILSFCNEWAFNIDPHITTVTLNSFVIL